MSSRPAITLERTLSARSPSIDVAQSKPGPQLLQQNNGRGDTAGELKFIQVSRGGTKIQAKTLVGEDAACKKQLEELVCCSHAFLSSISPTISALV